MTRILPAAVIALAAFAMAGLPGAARAQTPPAGPVAAEFYLLAWLGLPLLFGLDLMRKRLTA
mgnify:CR=1 FL=1